MSKDRFMFFANFDEMARKLPDDMRLRFYDAINDYVFRDKEPDDPILAALIVAIKPSLDKEERRGGAREGAGAPQKTENPQNQKDGESKIIKDNQRQSKLIKNNQKQSNEIKINQNNQSFLETETETETETEKVEVVKTQPHFDLTPLNAVLGRFGLPKVQKLTDDRRRKLKLRCEETGGYDEFIGQVEAALANSSFLRGDNRQGWRAGIDFFLQQSSWQKVLEGVYNDGNGSKMEKERHNFDWI